MAEIKTYQHTNTNKTIGELVRMIEKGTAKFDNPVQRSLVWSKEQKSLLISSVLMDAYIPPLCASKIGREFDMVDGKQRSYAFYEFLHDEFKLEKCPLLPMDDGTKENINGHTFSTLREELQDIIKGRTIRIEVFDNLTQEEFADIFTRINNATMLRKIEKNIARTKCAAELAKIAECELFSMFSKTQRAAKRDYDVITKSFMMLRKNPDFVDEGVDIDEIDEPTFHAKELDEFIQELVIDDDKIRKIREIYDRIFGILSYINDCEEDKYDYRKNKSIVKIILKPTHLVSIVPFVAKYTNDKRLLPFIWEFYSNKDAVDVEKKYNAASINTVYNAASNSGSGAPGRIKERQDALEKEWKAYKKKHEGGDADV